VFSMKRVVSFTIIVVFTFMFMLSFIPTTFVSNAADVKPQGCYYGDYYFWMVTGTQSMGAVNKGNWELKYTGHPATRSGEVDTISFTTSYTHELTGTINVAVNIIEGEVGGGFFSRKN